MGRKGKPGCIRDRTGKLQALCRKLAEKMKRESKGQTKERGEKKTYETRKMGL